MSRNDNVKKRKVNKRRRKKKAILFVFLVFCLALLCGLSLTVFFPVEKVTASGSELYSSEQIVNASGITAGENLLRLSEKDVLLSLQSVYPFVDSIKLTKKLPDTVNISVTEASQIFAYKIGETYYSTDDEGRVLKSYTEKPEDMLFIDCAAKLNEGNITYIAYDNENTGEIIDFVSKRINEFSLKADYLDLTDLYAVQMSFDSRFIVNFGEFTYFDEKLAHFLKMLQDQEFSGSAGTVNLSQYSPENPKAFFVKNEEKVENS